MSNLTDIHASAPCSYAHLKSLCGVQMGTDLVLVTKVLGFAYVTSPLRIVYASESNGEHQIPGSTAHKEIRQLPCYARGEC